MSPSDRVQKLEHIIDSWLIRPIVRALNWLEEERRHYRRWRRDRMSRE